MFTKSLILVVGLLTAVSARAGLDIQHWTMPEGSQVYFVENHDLPMLDVSVDFSAGSARDSREKSGLAAMTNRLLTLGAGAWSEQDVAERLADVGAVLSSRFDQDRAGFVLRTLSSPAEKDAALAVLKADLSVPRFEDAVLSREKARAISDLKDAAIKPEYQGDKAFQAAIYGQHPYALPESGEIETIAKLTRADLAAFHRQYYVAPNMVIAIMGDVTRAQAEVLAADLAVSLPKGKAPPPLPPVVVAAQGRLSVIPHHASQSHLFMGMPGMQRIDPDYFPLLVGNYILGGGGFDSRMLIEIRQKRGLAYSAYSYFSPMQERGPFQIGLQTRRDATDEALKVVHETLRRFMDEGPTEAELTQAKNNMVGGFPLRLDSNKKILEYLAVIGFYHLPLNWLDTYTKQVAAVTREDIMRAFRERVKPEALFTVIVGGQLGTAGNPQ